MIDNLETVLEHFGPIKLHHHRKDRLMQFDELTRYLLDTHRCCWYDSTYITIVNCYNNTVH